MITVTKAGRPPGQTPMAGRCKGCGTEIACMRDDTKTSFDQRVGTTYTVMCPTCGQSICCVFVEDARRGGWL